MEHGVAEVTLINDAHQSWPAMWKTTRTLTHSKRKIKRAFGSFFIFFLSFIYLFFNELFSDPVILWVKLLIFCTHCQQIQLKRPTLSVTDATNKYSLCGLMDTQIFQLPAAKLEANISVLISSHLPCWCLVAMCAMWPNRSEWSSVFAT